MSIINKWDLETKKPLAKRDEMEQREKPTELRKILNITDLCSE